MSESVETTPQIRIVNWLRFSIAGYVAVCLGIGLLLLTLVTWVVFDSEPQRVAWGDYVGWPQMLSLGSLGGIICFLAYWTVRLWNDDLPARERELEGAWNAGMTALRKRGVSIRDLPLFLVMGCQNEKSQASFLQTSGIKLSLEPIPKSNAAPLRWYIAQDRILLFCSDVGTFSATQSRLAFHRQDEIAVLESMEFVRSHSTPLPAMDSYARACIGQPENRFHAGPVREMVPQTMVVSGETYEGSSRILTKVTSAFATQVTSDASNPVQAASHEPAIESLEATERLFDELKVEPSPAVVKTDCMVRLKQQSLSVLASSEIVRYQALLEDTCKRLKVARANMAPINGIIAWVDAPQMMDCARFSRQCGLAFRRDSKQIQQHLGVLAPVTVVMDRMQELTGFCELIRRMGQEKSLRTSLGEAFDLQRLPDWTSIRNASQRSLVAVNAAVYQCFRSSNGLSQPGNHKLFQLIIACRGRLGQALQTFLIDSIAIQPQLPSLQDPTLFSGIYFTASGEKPTHQGFSQQVVARAMDQQEFLSWTKERYSMEQSFRLTTWLLSGTCLVLLIMLIAQILAVAV